MRERISRLSIETPKDEPFEAPDNVARIRRTRPPPVVHSSILTRLADVVTWICYGIAILMAGFLVDARITGDPTWEAIFWGLLISASFFGIGRAVRYVICGR